MILSVIKTLFRRKNKSGVVNVAPIPRMEKRDVERLFARVFLTEDGQKILSYLQATTFQRVLPTDSSEAQLRHMEGQRAMLLNIQRLVMSGQKPV